MKLLTLILLVVCPALPAGAAQPLPGVSDDYTAGLYLEKRGDAAGAYLKYLAASPSSPQAAARMSGMAAAAAAGHATGYQVLPFISTASFGGAGELLAARLQAKLAAAKAGGNSLRTAPMGELPPSGMKGPAAPVPDRHARGVSRYLVGEVLKYTVAQRRVSQQKWREVREEYEAVRYEEEEYQEEVIEASAQEAAVDNELADKLSEMASEASDKEISRKYGRGMGALGGVAAGHLTGKLLKDKSKGKAPEKKYVTKTRRVPIKYTEYRMRPEAYTVTKVHTRLEAVVVYGVLFAAGGEEMRKQRKVTVEFESPADKLEAPAAMRARMAERAAALIASDLRDVLDNERARLLGGVKKRLERGKKEEAVAECLRALHGNPEDFSALEGLRMAAGR